MKSLIRQIRTYFCQLTNNGQNLSVRTAPVIRELRISHSPGLPGLTSSHTAALAAPSYYSPLANRPPLVNAPPETDNVWDVNCSSLPPLSEVHFRMPTTAFQARGFTSHWPITAAIANLLVCKCHKGIKEPVQERPPQYIGWVGVTKEKRCSL